MEYSRKSFCRNGWRIGSRCSDCDTFYWTGTKVIIVDMNQEHGEAMQRQLGDHAKFVQLDVTE